MLNFRPLSPVAHFLFKAFTEEEIDLLRREKGMDKKFKEAMDVLERLHMSDLHFYGIDFEQFVYKMDRVDFTELGKLLDQYDAVEKKNEGEKMQWAKRVNELQRQVETITMSRPAFEKLVWEGIEALPEKFWKKIKNVAVLVEDEPSEDVRREERLANGETLFGLYRGIPATERGDLYGVGPTLPDTITIYRKPIEAEARGDPQKIRAIVADTVWHEYAHYFGLDEHEVKQREEERG